MSYCLLDRNYDCTGHHVPHRWLAELLTSPWRVPGWPFYDYRLEDIT